MKLEDIKFSSISEFKEYVKNQMVKRFEYEYSRYDVSIKEEVVFDRSSTTTSDYSIFITLRLIKDDRQEVDGYLCIHASYNLITNQFKFDYDRIAGFTVEDLYEDMIFIDQLRCKKINIDLNNIIRVSNFQGD